MPRSLTQILLFAAALLFGPAAFASLSFHTDKLQINPGDVVKYSLEARVPHGTPRDCQISFSIPSGMTFVRDSLVGGGGGSSQSFSCAGSSCTWTLRHVHQTNAHLGIFLRVDNGIATPPSAPSISNTCGLGPTTYVDPGAGHTVSGGGALTFASQPDLTINKTTTSSSHVVNGDEVDYQIEIHNRGTGSATNVTISDTIPANTQYLSHSGGTPVAVVNPAAGNPVNWTFASVAPGQTVSVTLKLQTISASGSIDNTADVNCDNCPATASSFAPTITIDAIPAFIITKDVNNIHVNAGDIATYTIDYRNTGSAAATGVIVTDMLPPGLSYVSSTPAGNNAAGTITWNIANVPAGQPGKLIVKALVDPTATVGDQFDNKATIDSIQTTPLDSNTVTIDVVGGVPVLLLEKTVDRTSAAAGEELTYTFTYRNVGAAAATGVVLTDSLPNGVTFVSASNNGSESGRIVTWDLPDILPGQTLSEFLKVEIDPGITTGPLTNQAAISSPNAFQNLVTGQGTTSVRAAPVLTLNKTVDTTHAEAGETVRYTIAYENIGTVPSTAAQIIDDVDGLLDNLRAPNGTISNQKITWDLGPLSPGASGSVTFDARVVLGAKTGYVVGNQALIEASNANSATAGAKFTVANRPELIIGKFARPTTVRPGEEVVFGIPYSNIGTATATNVTIEDAIPTNMELDPTSLPSGATLVNNSVVWTIPSLAPAVGGQFNTLSLRLRAKSTLQDGDLITNTASIKSNETPAAKTRTVNVNVVAAILSVTKTASVAQASPGDTIDYTINVENKGHTDATGVVIEDHLPPFMTLLSASGTYTEKNNNIIEWTIGTVAAGKPTSVTAKVQLAGSIPNGTLLNNKVQVRSNQTSATGPDTPVQITSAPNLTLVKSVDSATAKPGESVTYTISYSNTGTDTAGDVYLTDQFPTELDFVSASGPGLAAPAPVADIITWQLGDVAKGASGSFTVVGTVKAGLPDGTPITNTSVIGETLTQSNPKSTSATFSVDSKPLFIMSKDLITTTLVAGGEAIYHIVVENKGTADATNVEIEDILPAELTFLGATVQQPAQAGQRLTWSFPSWPAGAVSTIEYRVRVASPIRDGLTLSNSATLKSGQTGSISATASGTVTSLPVLTLNKLASATTVEPGPAGGPGGTIVYTLEYENTGSDTATGITLEDHLPSGVTFISASDGGTASATGKVVTWSNLKDFPAGLGKRSVTINVQANSADTLKSGTKLSNTATIDSIQTAPVSAAVNVLASGQPQLTFTKTASTTTVNAGQEVTFTLEYQNTGTADAPFVRIEDQVNYPNQITYVANSATNSGQITGNSVFWELGPVKAGEAGSVSLTARVADVIANGTSLTNTANLTVHPDSTYTTFSQQKTAKRVVKVNSLAALAIDKTANTSLLQAGGDVTYTIGYTNTGHDTANGVEIIDKLPTGLLFKSATGNFTNAGNTITWQVPPLPAKTSGSVTVTATAQSPIANGTRLKNTASIKSARVLTVTSTPVEVGVASAPVLEIEKTSVANTNAGGSIAYTITYRNTGTDQATNVQIEDHLPPEMTFVSASPTNIGPADTSGVLPGGGGVVKWNLGTLAAQQSGSLTLVAEAPKITPNGTQLFNSASISSNETSTTAILSRVTVSSAPVLTLEKTTATSVATPGSDITYVIKYANTGSATANAVTLVDRLPAGTTFLSADHFGEEIDPVTMNPAPGSGFVGWPMPNVAAQTSGTVTVTVRADAVLANGTVLTNTATIDSTETGSIDAVRSTPVSSAPQIVLQERTSQTSFVASGNQVLYTLVYENVGNDIATNLLITDTYPSTAIPIAIDSSGSFDQVTNQAKWNLSSLAPGQRLTVQYTLQVPLGTPSGTTWNTTSAVVAENAQPVSAGTSLLVDSRPSLTLNKIGSNSVEAGAEASYLIEYFNSGNGVATGVTIQDIIPPDWAFVSASNGGAVSSGNVVWNLGDVAPLSGGSVNLVLRTNNVDADKTVATNTATILGSNISPTSAVATTVERSHVELDVKLFGSPSPVPAGGRVSFNLLYENLGNQNATNVTVTASIPANTTYVAGSATNGGVASGSTVTWSGLSLAAITGGQVGFEVDVAAVIGNGTSLTSNATITAAVGLPDSDTASVVVSSAPVLITSKSVDAHEVSPGDVVTYTITVENIGTENATNLTITDQLPAGLQLLTAEPSGTVDSATNTASWTLANLNVGSPPTAVTATAKVLAANTVITNTATVSGGTGPDQQITNPQSNISSGPATPKSIPVMSSWLRYLMVILLLLVAMVYLRRPRIRHEE